MNQNNDRVFHSFATALTFWERSRGMHRPTGHSPCSLQNRPVGAGLFPTAQTRGELSIQRVKVMKKT